jgi:hypothetical protein
MQFAVPQFTDVEDKLIGPLTLKQFLVILGAGGLCFLFWSLPIPKVMAVLIDLPIALIGITVAFANYNGRPMLTYIVPFIIFAVSPKAMVFNRESNVMAVTNPQPKKEEKKEIVKDIAQESAESRLKKLAYLLDQKKEEEKDLIQTANRK